MEYHVREKKEEPKPTVGAEKLEADAVVQIDGVKEATKGAGKRPMITEKSVDISMQRSVMANDHKDDSKKSAADKYHQPRWCSSGLTHT